MKLPCIPALCFVLVFMILKGPLAGQMPDWIGVKDKEGNRLFFDGAGNVRTLGAPVKKFVTVSAPAIVYYINHAENLVKNHFKLEGLIIAKSILAMPAENALITQAQERASKIINTMIKKDGTRYEKLATEASLLMFRQGEDTVIIDDYMRFSLMVSGVVEVLRRKRKASGSYEHQGMIAGVSLPGKKMPAGAYDFLVAVDAEQFLTAVESMEVLQSHWELTAGKKHIQRTEILKEGNRLIREFSMEETVTVPDEDKEFELAKVKRTVAIKGFEGFFFWGNRGCFMKIIADAGGYGSLRGKLLDAVSSFKMVKD